MAKRSFDTAPVKSASKSKASPARTSIFRFADCERGPVKLGAHQTIHGAD